MSERTAKLYPAVALTPAQKLLGEAIERDWSEIQKTVRIYVRKTLQQSGDRIGITDNRTSIEMVAEEILQDTIETVFKKAGEFEVGRSPFPWILGIATNKIKKWRDKKIRERQRTIPVAEIPRIRSIARQSDAEIIAEDELFGFLQRERDTDPYGQLRLEEILSLVAEEHRRVLQLAYLDGLRGKALAATLGITENYANVKLCRARNALRKALETSGYSKKGEG